MFKKEFLILLLFLVSCSPKKEWITTKNGKTLVQVAAPNQVWINDTLMCDKTELCNIDYREYQQWILRVYGANSPNYKNTLLDSTIVLNFMETIKSDSIFKGALKNPNNYSINPCVYFTHPDYDFYPAVGLTYKQALDYSKWRSDRTFEMMLIEKNIIKIYPVQTAATCFTIEKYLAGQFFNHKPTKKVPIPRFRLPLIEEWELIAQKNVGDKESGNEQSKAIFLTKNYYINNNQWDFSKKILPYTINVKSFFQKNNIYNLIGNVAEMTNTEGVAKGGSWYHTMEQSKIKNNIPYDKQQMWLGIRNVCTWEILK